MSGSDLSSGRLRFHDIPPYNHGAVRDWLQTLRGPAPRNLEPIPKTNPGCRYSQLQLLPNGSLRREMCRSCPNCIQLSSIHIANERTPLLASSGTSILNNARCLDKVLMCLFFSLLVFGAGIGTYLLIVESKGSTIDEFNYISRENWGVNTTFLKNLLPLYKPVSKVLFLKLMPNCTDDGQNCLNYEEFFNVKLLDVEILYNFYQDIHGKIYEGRGWNFQSDCRRIEGCENVLTIALIDKPNTPPSSTRIRKLKAFLDYSNMENALKQCYEILIQHSPSRDFEDLAFTLVRMGRQDRTCKYFI